METYADVAKALTEPIQIRCACGGIYEITKTAPAAEELQSQAAPDRRWTCTGCYHNIYTGRYWGKRQ